MSRDALAVGINTYQFLPGLNAPAQDAEAIAQRLHTDGDFRVTRLPEMIQNGQAYIGSRTGVSLAELEAALIKLFKPRGVNVPHTALFYFSGHGLQKDAGIQEGYLATSDANPTGGFYGLSLFWLRRLLQESPVRQRIILLDCCHSGELLNFLEADPGVRPGTDRLFMAASREYETAYESITGQYSIFTQALLEGLDPSRLVNGTVTNYALTDWVSNALKGEMQQPLFENSGSEIILTRCAEATTILRTESSQECPYRGLECFDEAHAQYFFGREDLTDQLIEKLKTRNFVAVVGASGSGKSSLVRAGLIHQLRQGQKFSASDRWRIQLITPTDQPLKSLAGAFVNSKAPTIDRAEHLHRAEALLHEGGTGLCHLVRASLISSKYGRNSRLLLIIDQFEEVFTLCNGNQAERDRHRFFNALLTALHEASDCLSIVIVMRADFFGKCSLYNGLAEQVEQNLVTVTPLTYDQIKASVVKPAQKAGLVCETNLVYNILLDVVGAPGELPLLQYTLLELWQQRQPDPQGGSDRLTLDAYTQLGGVRGTLQKRADEIFYSLTPEEQRVARRIFLALTQFGDGTDDTRRRILKSELVSPRFPLELVDRVLEKLVVAKLIVTNQIITAGRHQERVDQNVANVSMALRLAQMRQGKLPVLEQRSAELQGSFTDVTAMEAITRYTTYSSDSLKTSYQETVDVAHETLIRNWSLLRVWLEESRDSLGRQRRIEHLAREWQAAHQPRSPEYLLHGDRLIEAEEFLNSPEDLSDLVQQYITVSRKESRRTQKEMRLLQMIIPGTLLIALAVTFSQYRVAIKNQAEKDYQLHIATSRQQAAIAQSILQEPNSDPTTALLISRLAAEQGGHTYEAQTSLRAALQKVPLQAMLRSQQGSVRQVLFSPDQQRIVTTDSNGTIRLWSSSLIPNTLSWGTETSNPNQPQLTTAPTRMPPTPHPPPPTPPQQDGSHPNERSYNNQPAQRQNSFSSPIFSPDSQHIAAIAPATRTVQIWSGTSGARLRQLEAANDLTQLSYSPNGDWLAGTSHTNVTVWQPKRGISLTFPSSSLVVQTFFSPDSQNLFIVARKQIQIWRVDGKKLLKQFLHPGALVGAAFSPNGQFIATLGKDGKTRLWQVSSGQLWHVFQASEPDLHPQTNQRPPLVFSPDGQYLAVVHGQQVKLWHVPSKRLQAQWQSNGIPQPAIAVSPDSQTVAIASQSTSNEQSFYTVRLWDVSTGKLRDKLPPQTNPITSVEFSRDGASIATGHQNGFIYLWASQLHGELPSPPRSTRMQWLALQVAKSPISSGELVPMAALLQATPTNTTSQPASRASGSNQMVALSQTGAVQTWNLPLPSSTRLFNLTGNQVVAGLTAAALSDDLRSLVTASKTGEVTLWTGLTSQLTQHHLFSPANPSALLRGSLRFRAKVHQLSFSPDQQTILGVADRTIYLWKASSGQLIRRLQGHTAPIEQAQFSPDDQRIVSTASDRSLRIWDVSTGQFKILPQHAMASSARFSPDGRLIVTAGWDGTARVLDAATGDYRVILTGHRGALLDAAFSPDGSTLVTASNDGTARLWDAETGMELATLRPAEAVPDPLQRVIFSPDGQYVVSLSRTGKLYIWAATWDELLRLARDRSLRQLQPQECLRYLRLPPSACPRLAIAAVE